MHHVAPVDSYMIDIAFFNDFDDNTLAFLILININTRKAYAKLLNGIELDNEGENIKIIKDSKSAVAFVENLRDLLNKNKITVSILKGDGEKAFNSKYAHEFYNKNEIQFIAAPISFGSTNHSSLAIIDRMIRTIRDVQYNMGFNSMDPNLMQEILNQYNNSIHSTLKMKPNDITPDIEYQLQRKNMQENFNISKQNGFNLRKGTQVLVYNDPNPLTKRRTVIKDKVFKILGNQGPIYEIVDKEGKINYVPRYKLRLAY
jgi:hypothetical protein